MDTTLFILVAIVSQFAFLTVSANEKRGRLEDPNQIPTDYEKQQLKSLVSNLQTSLLALSTAHYNLEAEVAVLKSKGISCLIMGDTLKSFQ